jgi:mannose-6-phosphate isomerase-like protein (cupin superfamily)
MVRAMADYDVKRIDELETLSGFLEGISMRQVREDLGIEAFGVSIIEMEPNADQAPEHDHSAEGAGGEMFAKHPAQLEQEELYVVLRGSGTVTLDGAEHELAPETIIRIGPAVTRKVVAGPDGLRMLAVGGVPGEAYGAKS